MPNNSTKVLPFFTYSVSFGRNFMLSQTGSVLVGKKYWEEGNVSSSHMLMFGNSFGQLNV